MQPNRTGIYASQISGHLWAPEGAYDALATVTLSTSTTTISFVGVPSGYKHLQVRALSRATAADTGRTVFMRFNSDSTTNYNWHYLRGDGASAFAGAGGSSGNDSSIGQMVMSTAANSTANAFGVATIDILDYANVNKFKTVRSLTGNSQNTTTDNLMQLTSGAWRSTSAVTSISFTVNGGGDFAQYSQFSLYGVK